MVPDTFLITCEHGGNRIPAAYRALFAGQQALLATHRGYDAGALPMARYLARRLAAPLVGATVSRLLVDLNRSIGHPQLFSERTRSAAPGVRARIIAVHYLPYRRRVEDLVAGYMAAGCRVLHISSHSFTPELHGQRRTADIGLLYDPVRRGEARLCARWKAALGSRAPGLRVRRNYPYRGSGVGLAAHLRRRWPAARYLGIELEINQGIVHEGGAQWAALRVALVDTLLEACGA
jgi:predicted N-formylglutamate amidohydrolase